MFLTKLKTQNHFGSFRAVEPFPVISPSMGMNAGQGLNDVGAEFEQYPQIVGKSLTSKGANLLEDEEKEQKRKRAKRANEICRIIGNSAGLHPFFFDKFLVWSDYVEGKLSEEDFTEKVREEVSAQAALLTN